MTVTIRPMRADEADAVGLLCTRAYAAGEMAPESGYWEVLRDTAARARDNEVWVADLAGDVAGTVTWCPPGSPHREIGRDGEAEFRMLAVDPDRQGSGVGTALIDALLQRAREEGCTAVVLSSSTWMTSAHRLYERAGFVRTPALDWSPGPGVSLLAYRLDLGPRGEVTGP